MKGALDTTFEVSKVVKYSLKRDVKFEKLKESPAPDNPGICVLCPTKWEKSGQTDTQTVL